MKSIICSDEMWHEHAKDERHPFSREEFPTRVTTIEEFEAVEDKIINLYISDDEWFMEYPELRDYVLQYYRNAFNVPQGEKLPNTIKYERVDTEECPEMQKLREEVIGLKAIIKYLEER